MADLTDRRRFLIRSAAGAAMLTTMPAMPGRTTPQAMRDAIRQIVGEAAVQQGRVRLDVPALVENGNAVPLTVSVEGPMTDADHVRAIHVLNEKNPQPHVISAILGPGIGRATLATRIKLADSQQITAIAEMSDGSFWSGAADVIVTVAACVEDLEQ
jgi:sulfur-oxidizing protein SoxY